MNQFQDVTNVIPGSIGPVKYYTKNATPYHHGDGASAAPGGTKVAEDNDMIDANSYVGWPNGIDSGILLNDFRRH